MILALEALQRLKDGNQRFVVDSRDRDEAQPVRNFEFVESQNPFAIILGCSDSRVPAEIVFDQGLGDLFVIRVAGNVVAPSQIGSIEFAAERFGTRLVVVMGHTECGAVTASLEALKNPQKDTSPNLLSIVNRIVPSIEKLYKTNTQSNFEELLEQAVRANISASVNQLRQGSQALESLIQNEGLQIVGAEYSLKTGVVEFLE